MHIGLDWIAGLLCWHCILPVTIFFNNTTQVGTMTEASGRIMSPCAKSTDCLSTEVRCRGVFVHEMIHRLKSDLDPYALSHADLFLFLKLGQLLFTGLSPQVRPSSCPLKSRLVSPNSPPRSRWSPSLPRRCPAWPSAAARTGTSGRGCTWWGRCCGGGPSGSGPPPSPPSCPTRRPWTPAGDTWTWISTAASPAAYWGEFGPNKLESRAGLGKHYDQWATMGSKIWDRVGSGNRWM